MGTYAFIHDERLGIALPDLNLEWDNYSPVEQAQILDHWETIRSRIPDHIIALEKQIMRKQDHLNNEEHFPTSCSINAEIAELASKINDLNLWYRTHQEIDGGKLHA